LGGHKFRTTLEIKPKVETIVNGEIYENRTLRESLSPSQAISGSRGIYKRCLSIPFQGEENCRLRILCCYDSAGVSTLK
jgi:hypothetical protein